MHSQIRNWALPLAFAGLLAAGCGGYTNENTPVKVVTDEEMEQMHEANEKIAEMGLKQMGSPAPKASQKK